jgi:hypothetical protein
MDIEYWRGSQKVSDPCEDEHVGWDGMDQIDMAQDRDQWRALVNTVMNVRVP